LCACLAREARVFVKAPSGGCERFLSLRACEAISLLAVCWLWKGEIAMYLAMTEGAPTGEIATLRSPSYCQSTLWVLRACEAISLLAVCWLWTGEIATYLAMT